MKKMMTIVYIRISTSQQSTDSQKPDIERYLAAQDPETLGKVLWFEDTGTGRNMERPGWRKAETWIRSGIVDRIICWRLDRLARNISGMCKLVELLQAKNTNLVSLKENIDLSTPTGRLMINVLSSFAVFETEVRGERVLAGQAAARAKGKKIGGSKKGVRRRVTDAKIETIYHLRDTNHTYKQICEVVLLSRETVSRLLKNRI
ncbi:MAG: recombinase family protein [Planctomycetota bacterium]